MPNVYMRRLRAVLHLLPHAKDAYMPSKYDVTCVMARRRCRDRGIDVSELPTTKPPEELLMPEWLWLRPSRPSVPAGTGMALSIQYTSCTLRIWRIIISLAVLSALTGKSSEALSKKLDTSSLYVALSWSPEYRLCLAQSQQTNLHPAFEESSKVLHSLYLVLANATESCIDCCGNECMQVVISCSCIRLRSSGELLPTGQAIRTIA